MRKKRLVRVKNQAEELDLFRNFNWFVIQINVRLKNLVMFPVQQNYLKNLRGSLFVFILVFDNIQVLCYKHHLHNDY